MHIMLKEIKGSGTEDRTVNPTHVISIKAVDGSSSIIELIGGEEIKVIGNVREITKRLNQDKRLLKG